MRFMQSRKEYCGWGSEEDIEMWVRLYIEDIIAAFGLDIDVYGGLSISNPKQDVLQLLVDGKLIGFIQAKRPNKKGDKSILDDESVLSECLDYLYVMKHVYGVHFPFAIVTSFEEWRFCWLPECDEFAESSSPTPPSATGSSPSPSRDCAQKQTPNDQFFHHFVRPSSKTVTSIELSDAISKWNSFFFSTISLSHFFSFVFSPESNREILRKKDQKR